MTSERTVLREIDGPLSGLLRGVERKIEEQVEQLWQQLPEPRDSFVEAIASSSGLDSKGKGVLRDLIYKMVVEHGAYRHNILKQYGACCDAQDNVEAMKIDRYEQEAEALAALRAQARLWREPVPEDVSDAMGWNNRETRLWDVL